MHVKCYLELSRIFGTCQTEEERNFLKHTVVSSFKVKLIRSSCWFFLELANLHQQHCLNRCY